MPDIKSAMAQIANQIKFDDDDSSPTEISKAQQMWEFVKANPGTTANTASKQFGLTPTRAATMLLQQWEAGKLSREGKPIAYSTVYDTYEQKGNKNVVKKPVKLKKVPKEKPQPRPTFTPQVSLDIYDASSVLTNMNVVQARKVYDELKKVFG